MVLPGLLELDGRSGHRFKRKETKRTSPDLLHRGVVLVTSSTGLLVKRLV